jgi:hypothetical protein
MPSELWRQLFAMIGAAVVGSTAWARFVAYPFWQPGRVVEPEVPVELTPP